ncbi:MAG TPA: hypothetical protein DCZ69_17215 [Syntrophobacteraceae bacterium]|jgi:hypothetical protein|nr:hypothetical protein [Syntrophobacteraceae bacterium]HBD09993.1 hypothetical protein [Syntrophobacteraceae bacterium]HBZ54498.1 hypothetical protein [Syntrophobacteraceae bacterium]
MNRSGICTTGMFILAMMILVLPTFAHADRPQEMFALPSDYYRQQWCTEHRGATDVRMADGSSADCITSTHVVQFQFAPKWAEAIGPVLYYSSQTGKRAGIVIIIKDANDLQYWKRLNATIEHFKLPIKAWKIE